VTIRKIKTSSMLTATEINLTKEFEKIERPGKIWKII